MTRADSRDLDRSRQRGELDSQGFTLLGGVFTAAQMQASSERLASVLDESRKESVLRSRGQTYGSRNLREVFPEVADLVRTPVLAEFAGAVLGHDAGLVRALFFDKPPDRSWSLPWHRDRTIAVKRNDLPSSEFRNPTTKAGVPHVEAPDRLLRRMLTFRVHLDAMTDENGPLVVIPGTHDGADSGARDSVVVHSAQGDVLAMRPLLSHSSRGAQEGTTQHRRVIHLELAADASLPDGYAWRDFLPLQ